MTAKRNAPCVIVDDLPWDVPAGHTKVNRDQAGVVSSISFGCPCGCGAQYGAKFPGWTWVDDGPTITPSLGCYPTGRIAALLGPDGTYHWHGFLRAGVFEEC